MAAELVRSRAIAQRKFEKHRDLRQASAQIIVNVLGDPGALTVEGSLAFESLQFNAVSTRRNEQDTSGNKKRKARQRARPEPPGLPKERQHDKTERGPVFIPDSGIVAGADL